MSGRRPTERQVLLLGQAEAGTLVAGVDSRRLVARDWVDPETLRLTPEGQEALRDARDLAEWEAIPYADRPRVSVERKRLGQGWGARGGFGVSYGRTVACYVPGCPETKQGLGREVWSWNESGREADQYAEQEQRRHGLAHVRGEVGSPNP